MVSTVDELKQQTVERKGSLGGLGASTTASSLKVDENAARIMASDSPLMQRADTTGRQYGASRGLMNSSLAAGAATSAALDYVVPMATTEASNLNSARMNSAQIAAATEQAKLDREADMAQLTTQINAQTTEAGLDRTAQFDLQQTEIGANRDLADLDATVRTNLTNLENQSQERIAALDIDQNQRSQAADMVTNMQQLYNDTYGDIINNTSMSAEERSDALSAAGERLGTNMSLVEDLYSIDISWQPVGGSTPVPVTPAPTSTGGLGEAPKLTDAERREQQILAAQRGAER